MRLRICMPAVSQLAPCTHDLSRRSAVAARLGLKEFQVTVESPEMGGGFGQKIIPLREDLCLAAASRLLDRPVRWRESRAENLTATMMAREESIVTRAAVATRFV